MKILLNYLKNYRSLVFLILILAAINTVFSLLDPYIIGRAINKYVVHASDYKGQQSVYLWGILGFSALAIGAAMISRIAKNFQDYFANVVTQKLGTKIYTDGVKHTLELPYDVFEDQRSGETLGRLQKIRQDSERVILSFINIVYTSLVGIIFVIVVAVKIYWPIGPIYLATIPIITFVSLYLGKKIKEIQKRVVGQTTALAGATTESLRNIELVKSLGLTDQEVKRLNLNSLKILQLELMKVKVIRSLGFIQGTTINLLRNGVVFLLFYLIFQDKIEFGDYVSLFMYSFFIFNPLQELGSIIQQYREAQVSLGNFKELLSTPSEPKPEAPQTMGVIEKIDFNNVSFKHRSSAYYALNEISFSAKKGETIAFVGPSGSGKSTLVKLLLCLYKPEIGEIKFNGIGGNYIDKDELRKQIGLVTQDAQLYSGSIKDNLLFVKPNATDEECLDVLKKAACDSLMNRADKGLDTTIGEGGIKISGGEKQRLSIARALLRNPNLLIFDEATSALDSITEEQISETIRSVSGSGVHLTVLIAHRLSTIMHADRIFVLEKGKIIETGNHDELLDLKGLYYAMWRQQIGEKRSLVKA